MAREPASEDPNREPSDKSQFAPPAEDFDRRPHAFIRNPQPPQIDQQGYDPRPQEDEARRNIAYWLIALLSGICLGTFATFWFTTIPVEDVLKIVEILLGPIVALVSAATGFYYGTKKQKLTYLNNVLTNSFPPSPIFS